MKNGTLRLSEETLKLIIKASGNLKSERDVMDAYSKILPILEDESAQNEISDNVPEELRPMANALYGVIHGSDD